MNRPFEVLKFLTLQEDYVTIELLSHHFNVSNATMRNDLHIISQFLEPLHYTLEKKRGIGIRLHIKAQERSKLLSSLRQLDQYPENENEDLIKRKKDIILHLLNTGSSFITTNQLAKKLNVSRATLQISLNEIKYDLNEMGILLESKKKSGLRLNGNEKAIRSLYVSLFQQHDFDKKISQLLHLNPEPVFHSLRQMEQNLQYHFTEESFQLIAIHIIITVRRVLDGNSIQWEQGIHYDSSYVDEQNEVNLLCDSLEDYYHISINMGERYLIYLYVISSRVSLQESLAKENKVAFWIAKEIISLLENVKQITIDSSKYLESLLIHLQPMLNRLQNNIHITNPMLKEIKREYADAFGLAFMTNSIFNRFCNTKLNEDEIGFIAIHIQSMLEDRCNTFRVLIICNSGIGVSQLLTARLKSYFPNLAIIDTLSHEEYLAAPVRNDIDFILSTIPIKTKQTLIIVSPLLTDADINAINQYIRSRFLIDQGIHTLLDTYVCIHPPLSSQKEVIDFAHEKLIREENVTDQFAAAISNRESISSTAIGNHTAIPHASFETVKKSAIMIVTLENPLQWGSESCDLIIFIALTRTDSLRLKKKIRELFYQLYNEELHQKIIKANVKETIYTLLKL